MSKKDFWKQIGRMLSRLSTVEKEVFLLRFFDQLTIKEMSAALHKSESTIKTHLYRALRKFKAVAGQFMASWRGYEASRSRFTPYDDDLLRAMIDPSDLDAARQAHLHACRYCRRQTEDLTDRYRRLGQMAREMRLNRGRSSGCRRTMRRAALGTSSRPWRWG